ncbi:hypothetical protein JRQ81_007370 [Phrynocephalus forsythii]|uniref:Uncharacterized protein n=1 Tax=Phrynocephalus forsythii TaxID=171643 RepID=A0A9Q0XDZ9_9SAUR|nr:hypothetical protein JRQ81_007370 [Phrynocephalus forsythii]
MGPEEAPFNLHYRGRCPFGPSPFPSELGGNRGRPLAPLPLFQRVRRWCLTHCCAGTPKVMEEASSTSHEAVQAEEEPEAMAEAVGGKGEDALEVQDQEETQGRGSPEGPRDGEAKDQKDLDTASIMTLISWDSLLANPQKVHHRALTFPTRTSPTTLKGTPKVVDEASSTSHEAVQVEEEHPAEAVGVKGEESLGVQPPGEMGSSPEVRDEPESTSHEAVQVEEECPAEAVEVKGEDSMEVEESQCHGFDALGASAVSWNSLEDLAFKPWLIPESDSPVALRKPTHRMEMGDENCTDSPMGFHASVYAATYTILFIPGLLGNSLALWVLCHFLREKSKAVVFTINLADAHLAHVLLKPKAKAKPIRGRRTS